MEIRGSVEVQGFTTICDLDDGAVFAFCDDDTLFMKGFSNNGCIYAIDLIDGRAYNIDEECWWDTRPVRQIKAVLTVN